MSYINTFIIINIENTIYREMFIIFSTIRGRIDQVNQVLELDKESRSAVRYTAMDKWANQLHSLQLAVINKMA